MKKEFAVFSEPPSDFHPKMEAAGCYCEFEGQFLFVKRNKDKSQGNKWGVPGGKLEKGETPEMATIREVYEETGILMENHQLEKITSFYMRTPEMDYIWHMYRKRFDQCPSVHLAFSENEEARWTTFDEACQLPCIFGGIEALYRYKEYIDSQGQNRPLA